MRSPTHSPLDYEFFTDRDTDSPTFVDPLVDAGFTIHRFYRHAGPETRDPEWIARCAGQGWIGLSCDRRIGRRPDEIAAVMEAGAALFILKQGRHTNHALLAENFLRTAERIVAFYEGHDPPFIASVTRPNQKDWDAGKPGRVRMWRAYDEWLARRNRNR